MDDYTRQVLRVAVAQICQTLGWHTIQSTPLELLTDILHKYLQELSRETHRYTELYGRTEANLDDVGLAFQDLSINVPDLVEYISNVDSVPCAVEVPKYPIHKESSLNFLKPGSKEVVTRPVHVHEYLPAIHPEKEVDEEDGACGGGFKLCPSGGSTSLNDDGSMLAKDSLLSSKLAPNGNDLFKKPEMIEMPAVKKPRILHEDEGRPTREISSVMMTSSGFISPAREGKLPDSKTPVLPDYKQIGRAQSPQPAVAVPIVPPPAVPVAQFDSKPEKKGKRQRSSTTTAAGNATSKEQRKRDRQLAKQQKLNAAAAVAAASGATTPKASASSKKQRIKHMKSKHAGNQASAQPSTSFHSAVPLPPLSTAVPFPPALTKKPESGSATAGTNLADSSIGIGAQHDARPTFPDVKLSSEPDKQKSNIFKKISKKARDDGHHHHHAKPSGSGSSGHYNLYGGFPPLPESTTIRAIPPVVKTDPAFVHPDPNIIVVDDDPTGPLDVMLPSRPPPSLRIDRPVFPKAPTVKAPRKPRKNKQQQQQQQQPQRFDLMEQSAPLNLSSEMIPPDPSFLFNPCHKPHRKPKTKGSRANKRTESSRPDADGGMQPPPPTSDSRSRNEISLNMLKDSLSGMSRFPGMMMYQFPHQLMPRPGLIPAAPLLRFQNPFAYNDFMSMRQPLRPVQRMDDNPPSPLPPLELDSTSVYCNVAPLVPDSLKFQLTPPKSNLSTTALPSTSSHATASSSSSTLDTIDLHHSRLIAGSSSAASSTITKLASPANIDAPIEISDDEKMKSDTDPDKSPVAESTSAAKPSPNKSSGGPSSVRHSKMIVDDDCDDVADSERDEIPSEGPIDDPRQSSAASGPPERSEKRREKEHKKGKRGKDGKFKKKKEKKDKSKSKERTEKQKEEKREKDRTKKQKKEKRKEKLRAMSYNSDDAKPAPIDNQPDYPSSSSVPKLTLKFGSPRSGGGGGDDSSDGRKICTKVVTVGGGDESIDDIGTDERRESSPELARISPLVTRPPKQKSSTKDKSSDDTEQSPGNVASTSSSSAAAAAAASTGLIAPSVPQALVAAPRGPGRPPKHASTSVGAATVSAQSSPAASTSTAFQQSAAVSHRSISSNTVSSTTSTVLSGTATTGGVGSSSGAHGSRRHGGTGSFAASATVVSSSTSSSAGPSSAAIESTDAEGNQVWICPACGRVDDGTPMIGCDGCDAWYHWVCVGIQVPPDVSEDWYCRVCIAKKQETNGSDKKKKRKKKNKAN